MFNLSIKQKTPTQFSSGQHKPAWSITKAPSRAFGDKHQVTGEPPPIRTIPSALEFHQIVLIKILDKLAGYTAGREWLVRSHELDTYKLHPAPKVHLYQLPRNTGG